MKLLLKIMFVVFCVWMLVGGYLIQTDHKKAQLVMGLGVLYLAFIFMPSFIYHRYKDGKYKKYILNDEKLRNAFSQQGKK